MCEQPYEHPHPILTALLFGIAVLMTIAIYFAFWNLLRLKFSPGYAAFTFPMAIGATALYKLSDLVSHYAARIASVGLAALATCGKKKSR